MLVVVVVVVVVVATVVGAGVGVIQDILQDLYLSILKVSMQSKGSSILISGSRKI